MIKIRGSWPSDCCYSPFSIIRAARLNWVASHATSACRSISANKYCVGLPAQIRAAESTSMTQADFPIPVHYEPDAIGLQEVSWPQTLPLDDVDKLVEMQVGTLRVPVHEVEVAQRDAFQWPAYPKDSGPEGQTHQRAAQALRPSRRPGCLPTSRQESRRQPIQAPGRW